ncbi:MAG: O-antigen ligase family protein [Candidatus Hydrogenedentes bacterium]|nr:O-antigen ligase family protein [Candidatus Hydrogenedentota bacterium]
MAESVPASTIPLIRMHIIVATIAASGLAYSFHFSTFLHAKVLALAAGLLILGVMPAGGAVRWGIDRLWPLLVLVFVQFLLAVPAFVAGSPPSAQLLTSAALIVFAWNAYPLFDSEENRSRISSAIIGTAAIASVLGIAQYTNLLNFLFPRFPGAAPMYSVFGNPGLLGGYVAMAIPLLLVRYAERERIRPLEIIALSLLTCALLLSGARTAWLACAVGCFVAMWPLAVKPARLIILAIPLLLVSVLCVVFAPEQTIVRAAKTLSAADAGPHLRWWFWAGTFEMIRDHMFFGVGMGNFVREAPQYLGDVLWAPGGERYTHNNLLTEHPHNEILMIWAETGLFGLIMFGWLLFSLFRCRGPEWGGLTALLVFSLFNYPFHCVAHALSGLLLTACLLNRHAIPTVGHVNPMASRIASFVTSIAIASSLIYFIVLPSHALRAAQTEHIEGRSSLELYKRAIAIRPGCSESHEAYGIALLDAGDFENARDQFRLALRGSDAGSIHLGLGLAEMKCGDSAAAREALRACVHRWPSHVDAWRLLISVTPVEERAECLQRAERFLTRDQVGELRAPLQLNSR